MSNNINRKNRMNLSDWIKLIAVCIELITALLDLVCKGLGLLRKRKFAKAKKRRR
jgi:hypothetical protein